MNTLRKLEKLEKHGRSEIIKRITSCMLVITITIIMIGYTVNVEGTVSGNDSEDTISGNEVNIEETEYEKTVKLVSELEEAAVKYIGLSKYNKYKYDRDTLVFTYIRGVRYGSSYWNSLAGSRDVEFDKFINENYSSVAELRKLTDLEVPTSDKIDFIHMVASMNMIDNTYGVIGSWGGDLCDIIAELKNNEENYDKIYSSACKLINSDNSKFNSYDMAADLDANNIYSIMKRENASLSKAMTKYYSEVTTIEQRITQFINNKYELEEFTKNTLSNKFLEELMLDWCVDIYLSNKGVEITERPVLMKACVDAFTEYLYNIYPDLKIENIEFKNKNKKVNLKLNEIAYLKYETTPSYNIKNKDIIIEYNNKDIIEITDNQVKPLKIGTSTVNIYNKLDKNVSDTLVIKVIQEEKETTNIEENTENQVKENNTEDIKESDQLIKESTSEQIETITETTEADTKEIMEEIESIIESESVELWEETNTEKESDIENIELEEAEIQEQAEISKETTEETAEDTTEEKENTHIINKITLIIIITCFIICGVMVVILALRKHEELED